MRYVIANRKKAVEAGFGMFGRNTSGRGVVLNEKEVMVCPRLVPGSTLEERAGELGGRVVSHNEITNILNNQKKKRKK